MRRIEKFKVEEVLEVEVSGGVDIRMFGNQFI